MASLDRAFTYPVATRAHAVPSRFKEKQNPRLVGWILVAASYMFVFKSINFIVAEFNILTSIERLGFLRRYFWHNAGFGVLRSIRVHIDHTEPRFDPTVLPSGDADLQETGEATNEKSDHEIPFLTHGYSVAHYHSLFLSGELTPLDLAKAILPLIRRDTSPPGPHSTAWTEVKVDIVLKDAEEATQRYKEKRSLGPLDGVPTAVKDSFDIRGYKTTLGSPIDLANRDENGEVVDSWCVRKLKDAGAIILGKLSMHEFGLDTSGVNITYGTPRNPYNSQYYTGGSSSGSAYAVAAGLVPFALGTDGGGSVRIPASFCSVFGLKPTHGRLSYHPGQNHSNTCEVNGLMATDIRSLASAYALISQPHPDSCFPAGPQTILSGTAGRSRIIGIPDAWFRRSTPAVQAICRAMIQKLVQLKGYTIVPVEIPFLKEGQMAHALTILTDAATGIADNTHLVSPANRILAALGGTTPATDYLLAQKLRAVLMQHLAFLWKQHPGMIIVTPTTACAGWPIRSTTELEYGISDGNQTLRTMEYVWLANFCGLPSFSMPAGYVIPEGQAREGEIAESETIGKVPVGLMATAEWTKELDLMEFGLNIEAFGAESQVRPSNWVDIVSLANKEK